MSRGDSPAALLDDRKLLARTDPNAAVKLQRIHVVRSRQRQRIPEHKPRLWIASGGNGQSFAALRPAAFEHNATVLRVHPNQKTMGAPTTAAVGLIRAFHWAPGRVVTPWRNLDRNEPWKRVSTSGRLRCLGFGPMVESRAFRRPVSPGEFSTTVENSVEILGFRRLGRATPGKT